ncbi:hypothetical protein [Celeribacter persicus]|jgi:hypothetical protein|uniref:Uncharacterized protein n=1 Tax=Celeribacter persicus TaxID=1651082 RepID=A0A2T5HU78_9RHOB|nr:hypothetical protein [Celeribacter persicus]PTQ75143.1 hypothetical protein C8N42_10258 [Celeribacter persicus]
MAMQSTPHFSTFQGRAPRSEHELDSFRHRMRVPVATLVLGLIAALAIAGGALDRVIAHQVTGGLTDIEYLTGTLPVTSTELD